MDSRTKARGAEDLPLEMWLLITNCLPALDLMRLSHASRKIRAMTTSEWPHMIRDLSPAVGRGMFLAWFARISLDHWLCTDCACVHRIRLTDAPTNPDGIPCKRRPRNIIRDTFHGLCNDFSLRHNHIQAALKYKRTRNLQEHHQQHLDLIMTPYTVHAKIDENDDRVVAGRAFYGAWPRIMRGRFLLFEEWKYTPWLDDDYMNFFSARDVKLDMIMACIPSWCPPTVCPHFGPVDLIEMFLPSRVQNRDAWSEHLVWLIENSTARPRSYVHVYSCPHCPTDCEIRIEEGRDGRLSIVVAAWSDFGGEGSPRSREWQAHLRQQFRWRDYLLVREVTGYPEYDMGSIRGAI